jgi:polysaccharide biosynthesis transport protein
MEERTPQMYRMEEEIDLRAYVEVLIRRWWWIAGCALIAAATAFIVSLRLPPTYEASALVMITEPRYQMQFEPRFEAVEQWSPAYKAFPALATSDDLLQRVVESYTPTPQSGIEEWKLQTLSGMVEATSEGDPSLVMLKVNCPCPEDAAGIANAWASVMVQHGNAIYSGGSKDVDFFETQTAQAKNTLEEAEQALIDFQASNRTNIISATLNSRLQSQTDYLADQRAIDYIIQDVEGLRNQLSRRSGTQSPSLADELTLLLLQVKAFNAQVSTPIQVQLDSAKSLSEKTLFQQIAFLDDLVETLESKSSEIEKRLVELEPQILSLQQRLQEIQTKEDRLIRARNLAQETYTTLARKLEEARISAQEESGLQVGSHAAVPEKPTGPRKEMNTALAGAVGLMLGVFAAFAWEWWQGEDIEGRDMNC